MMGEFNDVIKYLSMLGILSVRLYTSFIYSFI